MRRISPLLAGLALCVLTGCAGQGLHLPFSGPRVTPADSAAVAAVEQRLQRVEAGQTELVQLVRGMNATFTASLAEIDARLRELSERQSSQERWIAALARESRTSSPGGMAPAPNLPPVGPGSIRLDGESRTDGQAPGQAPERTTREIPVQTPGQTDGQPVGQTHGQTPPQQPPEGAHSIASNSEIRAGESSAPDSVSASSRRPAEGARLLEPPEAGLRLYETAYRELRSDNYQIALINFREFLDRFPRTSLADNAQYWIGEAYYAQGQYDAAIGEFRKVIDEHPGEDKEPAAYYKIALSFKRLGDSETARRYFDFLIQRFPETHEAQLAREQLADL